MAESNGRVYDPAIARFLSPDPLLQTPNHWLSYNRYAYCMNNPMLYTDPSGMSWFSDLWDGVTNAWDWTWTQLNGELNIETGVYEGGLAQKMPDFIPTFNFGINIAGETFHEVGNSGQIYHNQLRANSTEAILGRTSVTFDNGIDQRGVNFVNNLGVAKENVNINANGGAKELLDQWSFIAGIKATAVSAYYSSKLSRWEMYKPLRVGFDTFKGSSKYLSSARNVKAAQGLGLSLTGLGILYDYSIGVPRYNRGIRDQWSVSPDKALVNTGVSLYSYGVNPTIGIVYFGFDAFYPGGFMGASEAVTIEDERMMKYSWFNYFNKQ